MAILKLQAYDKIADVTIPEISVHHDGYIFFNKDYINSIYANKDVSHIDAPDVFEYAWLSQDKCQVSQVILLKDSVKFRELN